jgi:hypothetical protein
MGIRTLLGPYFTFGPLPSPEVAPVTREVECFMRFAVVNGEGDLIPVACSVQP